MENLINKIHYGDAYLLIKEIPDKSIDLIYTDIPYLISVGGSDNSDFNQRVVRKKESLKEFCNGIDYAIFADFIQVSKALNCFIWASRLQVPEILHFFISRGFSFDILFLGKTNPMPTINNTFLPDVEYCLYFRDKGVRLNDGYDLKSKWYTSPINKRDKDLFKHPTIKPLALVTRHILHTSCENDIVLDPFAGSATTSVAAFNNNRRHIAFENNKAWYDIAVDRLNGIQANGQCMFFPR